ncbi:hypothetical protein GNE08_26240 [Trichormus variabilis ARAD]|uniref:Uncharacterized protein n=1 Tax=Trichormus variabilis N2B TaxID=2681315 RepID=A0ABR6S4M3_ANAVA|nr:hypothetical protein [Trichormus variabilis]MBC1217698.1 hypothetical protein [Trichormus variabilis ARAD]MBC1259028.1 hypothetical protein [Trichormus variabilis V5]MBC1301284.1 hypothetical protein [Trichormus variabilis N2B]MBC1324521.1 hypothetical protein [Trichormus variabilis 9RC]MBC1324579.1 hypothetical protein [Trichormus variabilis 9RC]
MAIPFVLSSLVPGHEAFAVKQSRKVLVSSLHTQCVAPPSHICLIAYMLWEFFVTTVPVSPVPVVVV